MADVLHQINVTITLIGKLITMVLSCEDMSINKLGAILSFILLLSTNGRNARRIKSEINNYYSKLSELSKEEKEEISKWVDDFDTLRKSVKMEQMKKCLKHPIFQFAIELVRDKKYSKVFEERLVDNIKSDGIDLDVFISRRNKIILDWSLN